MGIAMIATAACRYGSRSLKVGDEFEVRGQSDVTLYKALKWADEKPAATPVAPPPPAPAEEAPKRSYFRRVLPVAAPADPEPAAEAEKPKRAYKRRDLTAED